MPNKIAIKICGLSTPETLEATLQAGVAFVGLVFFPKSPRHVSLSQATTLAAQVKGRAQVVALCVNASDAELADIIAAAKPDLLQLHGAESPERVADIRARFGRPVMKALGISSAADLAAAQAYAAVSDRLLYDAKPPQGADLPGGNGVTFDWTLLAGHACPKPWMVSGGLTPDNVGQAMAISKAPGVDVSSGVESAPGVKDVGLIQRFVAAVRASG